MKFAEIVSEPAAGSHGYVWRWRAGNAVSATCFDFYYECVQDARRNGYEIHADSARGDSAPNRDTGSNMK